LNSILHKTKEIKHFKVFDMEDEWKNFQPFINQENNIVFNTKKKDLRESGKETGNQIIFLLAFAASMILIFACLPLFKSPEKLSDSLYTDKTTESIKLMDGSTVLLHPNSELQYYISLHNATERKLYLKGDAEFDITTSILPLKVYHDSIIIEVLGTKFFVQNINNTVRIININGTVKVSALHHPAKSRILQSGETYIYANGQFINPSDTLNQSKPKLIIPSEKIQKSITTGEVFKGSTYLLKSVIKNHLLKFYKKKIKLEKKTKLEDNAKVKLDLTKPYQEILEVLKNQGFIDFKQGECNDCYIIMSPVRK